MENANPRPKKDPGSFRDPSGFLFWSEKSLYRQVNHCYQASYDQLMGSGLYSALVEKKLLIPHQEVEGIPAASEDGYKIIRPEVIPFISYPYEWCFSQLKDAALVTLAVQKTALAHGMSLKDASAYNIQFFEGRPILVDTLSFEPYTEGLPWAAYRQFCQHFLAPLSLMSCTDIRLNQLFRIYMDGVPLDLASRLLPSRTWLRFSLMIHLHLHAKSQRHYGQKKVDLKHGGFSRHAFLGLIDHLETSVKKLKWRPSGTEWGEYYDDINYSEDAFLHKQRMVEEALEVLKPQTVWDLGANVGVFSAIAGKQGIPTMAFDSDPAAVEKLYIDCRSRNERAILPLMMDLTNPSSGLGWAHNERAALIERGPADTVLALAIIHHLAIGNNLPFDKMADFFSRICRSLVIEFVPKHDSQVQRLLVTRKDIFSGYTKQSFEKEFEPYFETLRSHPIEGSERALYLMVKRDTAAGGLE